MGFPTLQFVITLKGLVSIITVFILYGLHKGAWEPVHKTFVSELAPTKYRASVIGGYQMIIGIAALPASVIAGLLWDKISLLAPFIISLILSIISIVMLLFVKEKKLSS